jgi:hypothetical protein
MRVKLLHDCQLLTPIAKTGEWRDVEPEVADYLVGHGYARSTSGLHDRAVRKPDKPIHPAKKPKKSLADFLHAVERRDTYYIERHYKTTFRVADVPEPERKAAMAESGGTTGGYTVPPRFSRRIMALVAERAILRRAGAQVLPMDAATLQVPFLDVTTVQPAATSPFFGGLTLTWTSEAQTDRVCYVIDEWLLLEYAVCYLPCNPDTLVEAVSKGSVDLPPDLARAIGIDPALLTLRDRAPERAATTPGKVSFTPLTEIERAVTAAIAAVDFEGMARRAAEEAWDRARGWV